MRLVMWIPVILLVVALPESCLFNQEEVNGIKNEVKDFLKGLNVADNKVEKAVGLVSKAKSLSDAGISENQIQILMASDVTKITEEINLSEGQLKKAIKDHTDKRSSSSSSETAIECSVVQVSGNVAEEAAAKLCLEKFTGDQLICITGDTMGILNTQAVVEHTKDKSNTDIFLKTVISSKKGLLINLKNKTIEYKKDLTAIKTLSTYVNRNYDYVITEGETLLSNQQQYTNFCVITRGSNKSANYSGTRKNSFMNEMSTKFVSYEDKIKLLLKNVEDSLSIKRKIDNSGLTTHLETLQTLLTKLSNVQNPESKIYKKTGRKDQVCLSNVRAAITTEIAQFKTDVEALRAFDNATTSAELNTSLLNRMSIKEKFVLKELEAIENKLTALIQETESIVAKLEKEISQLEALNKTKS